METGVTKPERIMAIDALRGFDMLLIIFADRFFISLQEGANTPVTGFLAEQFDHPAWFGFHFYDIIMPLFLFVVGAVIPFSLNKRVQQTTHTSILYRHLIKRFIILFILGWIVQGNLLALDINKFHVFSNTLQAIAHFLLFGLQQYVGDYYGALTATGGFLILYLLLWYMYKNHTFVKV